MECRETRTKHYSKRAVPCTVATKALESGIPEGLSFGAPAKTSLSVFQRIPV